MENRYKPINFSIEVKIGRDSMAAIFRNVKRRGMRDERNIKFKDVLKESCQQLGSTLTKVLRVSFNVNIGQF